MTLSTVRSGVDTWINVDRPSKNYVGRPYLRLAAAARYALIYLHSPVPRGSVVRSATLRVKSRGTTPAGTTITARRTQAWTASEVTWDDQPAVIGLPRSVTLAEAVPDGGNIDIDVTLHLATVAKGSAHYGWRLETDAAATEFIYGFDAGENKPRLIVDHSHIPDEPTSLSPSNTVIDGGFPVLSFDYGDVDGDELDKIRVQIDPAGNGTAPAFDHTEDTEVPELDLSTTAYLGLANNASTQWRAKVRDEGEQWSGWSDWTTITRVDLDVVTLLSPSAGAPYVTEPSPPILWSYGGVQTAWQVRVFDADGEIVYDTHKRTGTATSHTIPFRHPRTGKRILKDDQQYEVLVRVWDDQDRTGYGGTNPPYAKARLAFTVDDVPGVTAPDSVTVTQEGETPWVSVDIARPTAPDSFIVLRKGPDDDTYTVVERGLDPADLYVSPGLWRYRSATHPPYEAYEYRAKAVENGQQSPPVTSAPVTTKPTGLWLIDFDRDLSVRLTGRDGIDSWREEQQGSWYEILGASTPAGAVFGQGGLSGDYVGMIRTYGGRTAKSFYRHARRIQNRPNRPVQLVCADFSVEVYLRNLSLGPHPTTRHGDLRYVCAFEFKQNGDN